MVKEKTLPVAITMGDPSGVGPEIIVKAFQESNKDFSSCVVIGVPEVFKALLERFHFSLQVIEIGSIHDFSPLRKTLQVLRPQGVACTQFPLGEICKDSGFAAGRCIEDAVRLALEGYVSAMVTAPIHKVSFQQAGFPYPGHTEFLAELTETKEYAMMMAAGSLKVVLATVHTSLASVPSMITKERIFSLLKLIARSLGAETKIGVCGLNPHAGEEGTFGREETEEITPAIEKAKAFGINVSGPWSGDTIFSAAIKGEFDVVLAMYHDQGLIPVKLLGVDRAVNITLGLPVKRISVGHGTAFDIAPHGVASHKSLLECLLQLKAGKV